MTVEPERLASEIAHVLFLDLVGYSRLSIEEQTRHVRELGAVVRAAPEFARAAAEGEMLCLDRGDGMALVFFRDPLAPVQCAVEIARALRDRSPHLPVRMGIHSGPVSRARDVNGQESVVGGGINFARSVMDCGDAGHILLSGSSAESVRQFERWSAALCDRGECVVKHGEPIHLYSLVTAEVGNPAAPPARGTATPLAPAPSGAAEREPAGGAVPLDSRFYVVRPTDGEFREALARQDSIVLVKGARQMGKTSLLARGLQQARASGARVLLLDFQTLNAAHLESAETLYLTFADAIADQLDLDVSPEDDWSARRGPNMNLERFLKREVLGRIAESVVWGLDEVDRLFTCPFGSEVFGLFRSWHNRRSLDPAGPWGRLTLAMAYATEAHLFISDLNQSPFNVGMRLTLDDFTAAQTEELNRRYGSPLPGDSSTARFHALLGGHPYLTRRGLDVLAARPTHIAGFEDQAAREEGPFGDHLRRLLVTLLGDSGLTDAVRDVLRGRPCPTPESFYRLRAAGLIAGDSAGDARPRCRLYATYLSRHLL